MTNLEHALLARKRAYAPYSKFLVGASIELKDGTHIYGANIENGSYGLSNCAERSALFSLLSQGYNKEDIISITIVGDTKNPISPCGACRQVMYELVPKNAKIYLSNLNGETKELTTSELLPYGFDLDEDSL
ncbi:Cytidine deaminase [Alteracholeplasma palmae J233]|uniref:Cytidine deaminase n=1 Tax=Alteracholeplasma palmae (strain ATCC 49389 / J233) TaxID=1318466 RepID=U4KKK4_ALTPJ|nr:cytidine deaminase [Alteracholeplasma palmae]CCV64162.1 Cytidine deaminase [Alteracholeplasma palmae J233]